jgi:glycosylphosphatidylinositol transamidase
MPLLLTGVPLRRDVDKAPAFLILKAANLCLSSTVISIITVLNFSLAATLTIFLAVPLTLASSSSTFSLRLVRYLSYSVLGLGWLPFARKEVLDAIWSWQVLSVWFGPFICIVYVPLVLQAGIVCLLPPK